MKDEEIARARAKRRFRVRGVPKSGYNNRGAKLGRNRFVEAKRSS